MSEKPNNTGPKNPERREFFGACRNAVLAVAGVVLGVSACAITSQGSSTESSESKKKKGKPKWVNLPEKAFEKGSHVFAIGRYELDNVSGLSLAVAAAMADARTNLVCHLYGQKTTTVKDGVETETTRCSGTLVGTETVDAYIEENDDGTAVYHVLVAVKK